MDKTLLELCLKKVTKILYHKHFGQALQKIKVDNISGCP